MRSALRGASGEILTGRSGFRAHILCACRHRSSESGSARALDHDPRPIQTHQAVPQESYQTVVDATLRETKKSAKFGRESGCRLDAEKFLEKRSRGLGKFQRARSQTVYGHESIVRRTGDSSRPLPRARCALALLRVGSSWRSSAEPQV